MPKRPAAADEAWPELPYQHWRDTRDTLHLWTQIVGKVRLARTPWVNHAWHATLYVTARGLTTSPIPCPRRSFEIDFDFVDHALRVLASDGSTWSLPLSSMPVADFHAALHGALDDLGLHVDTHGAPNEILDAIPFRDDRVHHTYDPEAARRFWLALVQVHRVFQQFRTGYLGKVSPVHFFWGSFDLAVTRFSGRPAPRHPGGIPGLPDAVTREAYSHEVSSAGFWPGSGAIEYPAFFSYGYPEPPGFRDAAVAPEAAFYEPTLGEYVLPYDAVREAADPEATLLAFLQSSYEAVADAGGWDRAALECPPGRPGVPRPL